MEDGPKDVEQLAQWVTSDIASAQTTLLQMEKAQLVRRVGAERRWALAGYVAPTDRPHLRDPRPRKVRQTSTLRQENERPESVTLPADRTPAWWVGVPREHFAQKQREQHERMRTSPIARQIKSYILGGGGNVS